MRIVAVADTHLFHDDLVVPEGDVFVHAGDLCRGGDLAELRIAAAWIAGLPHRHKVIVAGNHDWAFVREPAAARALFGNAHYLEDAETTIEGLRFYGSPWQPEFCGWAFNLERGPALAAVWAKIPRGIDVLVTHSPPEGFGDRTAATMGAGCADLRRRIAELEPQLHMFGHIHQDGGLWRDGEMTLVNVTTSECRRQATVLDLEHGVVTPVFVPPQRWVRRSR